MKSDAMEIVNVWDPAANQARRPILVAHRGGVIALDAPENSLAAINTFHYPAHARETLAGQQTDSKLIPCTRDSSSRPKFTIPFR